jgi:phosphoadenosine phosphosulfate reductase
MIDLSPLERHEKIALSFSGGKDSLTCVYLLRPYLDRVTIYHLDTGDQLPEQREVVAYVQAFAPHFVRIQGNVLRWIDQHGLPTDLLPASAHPIGQAMGEHRVKLVSRYDCCYLNLMAPLYTRMREDGNTLLIRGTKSVDMHRLPVASGDVLDGIELWYPLQDWTHDQVLAYLRKVGAPVSRVYDHVIDSPECARCTAWWSEDRQKSYLRRYHPELWRDYCRRLLTIVNEISEPLEHLKREAELAASEELD